MTALYDKIGSGYSATRRADSRIVAALVNALCLPRGSTVIDVGAGTGKIARAIADLGYSVLAVEPSFVMRKQAEEHPSVIYFEGVAERIPLADRWRRSVIRVVSLCCAKYVINARRWFIWDRLLRMRVLNLNLLQHGSTTSAESVPTSTLPALPA